MNDDYLPLCHIDILHEFLSGGGCPCDFILSVPSEKAAANCGLIVRQASFRFTVYGASIPSREHTRKSSFPEKLTFALVPRDPAFARYTDLPMGQGKVVCFAGKEQEEGEAAGGKLTMNLCASAEDLLPPVGKSVAAFVAISSGALRGATEGSDMPHAPSVAAPVYTAMFPARSTIWRYDFFASNSSASRLSIRERSSQASASDNSASPLRHDGLEAVTFRRIDGIKGPSGETSIAFEATQLIPMRARPTHRFQLLQDGHVLIETLPTPDLALSRTADGRHPGSRMFVHL